MKPLVSAAVFGLVPVPPMPDFGPDWSEHPRMTADVAHSPRPLRRPVLVAERMATKDELARIRDELEEIGGSATTP